MAQQGLNRVMVLGYLGGTPELKFTNDGKAVARFSVAVNERWKDSGGAQQERVEWIRVVSFGRLAEVCGNYLAKGRHVFLEGKLQTRSWDDREGHRRTVTEVIAGALRILDAPNRNGENDSQHTDGERDHQRGKEADASEECPF
jgi:single-strand DNA-binding protein